MKLREIKEVGFYIEVNDTDRKTIYEVIENTDEDWLKEDPEATLLIDTWLYDYTDENDRAIYFADGNLLSVYLDESNIDVVKIEDTKYKVFGKYGLLLIEDKPTYKEQLEHKTTECEELISEKDFYLQKIETLEDENEELNKRNNFLLQRLEVDDTETSLVFKLQRELENSEREFYYAIKTKLKYEQALDEIKSIVSSTLDCGEWIGQGDNKMENILNIINKAKDGE